MLCACPMYISAMTPIKKSLVMQVDGPPRRRDRPKRIQIEVANIDIKNCNLSYELAQDTIEWRNKILIADSNIVEIKL